MTYANAVRLLAAQDRNIRKVNGLRFCYDGFEYRLTYSGGFAPYVGIDRRKIGKRNFEYFGGVGAACCRNVDDVLELVNTRVGVIEEG